MTNRGMHRGAMEGIVECSSGQQQSSRLCVNTVSASADALTHQQHGAESLHCNRVIFGASWMPRSASGCATEQNNTHTKLHAAAGAAVG